MASRIVGNVFVIVLVKVYFLIPTIILGFVFYFMRCFYLFTSRSIKRLEGVGECNFYFRIRTPDFHIFCTRIFIPYNYKRDLII